jgi:hypothetical protein
VVFAVTIAMSAVVVSVTIALSAMVTAVPAMRERCLMVGCFRQVVDRRVRIELRQRRVHPR